MGIFENIFMKAKGAVDALGEKAGQFVDVSKLNIRVAELKSDLKNEFESLGKTVYNCEKNHIDSAQETNTFVSNIDNIYIQIEELKKQIAEMKNKVICKFCGGANENNALYCGKCGKKLGNSASESPEESGEDDFSDFED
ncbi:MAG: zinc ribbon domain-containing protein [Clostridia bacterium]|nr:zinc ribbon domain-containing protein [Clostridia bacterium]